MFKETPIDAEFDGCSLSSISLSPTSPQSPIKVTDINQDDFMNQDQEWTESEESDDSSSSGSSEDPDDTVACSSNHSSTSSSSAPSYQSDFGSSTSATSFTTEATSISTKSDRADLGILGRRRSESSPQGHHQQQSRSQIRKFSSSTVKEKPNFPKSPFPSSEDSSSPSSDSHSARSPSPLGPGSSPSSKSSPHPRSSSIVLLNQRSPSVAMRHDVALRAFRNSRTSPTQESETDDSASCYSTPSEDSWTSPVDLQIPVSAPLPAPSQSSGASNQNLHQSSTPERPSAQIRSNSSPLLNQRRRTARPNLTPLITPSPDQFADASNVEIIQDSYDEEGEEAEKWEDTDDEKADEPKEMQAPQPPSTRAAARKSLFSALGRDDSSQVLPKPSSNMNAPSSSSRRLPSLDQISSRVNHQNQVQPTISSPAPRGRSGQPVLSTPLPHQRSFSCPTPQTPLHQLFGSVEVFITPPTPRCPSLGKTDATMEVLRSPTNQAFAFVPAGTNERNRITLLETGSPLLTPSWNSNGFGFGNSTLNLVPPPFEIAPGRTKKMEEQAQVMLDMMKKQQQVQHHHQSQNYSYIPGSPIPPKANEAMSFARDQASKYFAPRRRMVSDPVGKGKVSDENKKQLGGGKVGGSGSGSESPNWRVNHFVPLSPGKISSSTMTTTRKPAGNHSQALEGIKNRQKSNEIQTQVKSSIQILVEEASPSTKQSDSSTIPATSSASSNAPVSSSNTARSAAGKSMLARLGQRKS